MKYSRNTLYLHIYEIVNHKGVDAVVNVKFSTRF